MEKDQEPQWLPITALSNLTFIIDEILDNTQENYQTIAEGKDKPSVFDDALVARIIKLYTTQLDNLQFYEEQLCKWKQENLTSRQYREINKLNEKILKIKEVSNTILDLARKIEENTIEKIIARDDIQLALDHLTGKLKF